MKMLGLDDLVNALPLEESFVLFCHGLYWDITSGSFWTRAWADFEVMWNRKGYLLNRSAMSR